MALLHMRCSKQCCGAISTVPCITTCTCPHALRTRKFRPSARCRLSIGFPAGAPERPIIGNLLGPGRMHNAFLESLRRARRSSMSLELEREGGGTSNHYFLVQSSVVHRRLAALNVSMAQSTNRLTSSCHTVLLCSKTSPEGSYITARMLLKTIGKVNIKGKEGY